MSKKLLIFTATLIIALNISAQNVKKLEKELAHSEIVINGKDSLVRCQVLVSSKDFKPNVREGYYWHDNNKINVNIGSYSGKFTKSIICILLTFGNGIINSILL